MDQMNEEEAEFGMDKTSLRETDPMEQEARSAVKEHADFRFLDPAEVRAAASSGDPLAVPTWMTIMPVEKDPSKWRILEVQLRPDRAWEVIKELVGTVCMSKGLLLTEENASSVLFRKKVAHESLARGMANSATFQNVFVRIGVSPSKLRVAHICTLVSGENKLLGGLVSTSRTVPWAQQQFVRTLNYALDQLLGALQATIIAQCLTLSHLYMSTPENSMDAVENAELDPGYIHDVKRMFASEMKLNMRDLCIPLEEYAYQQEFSCALLIGLLDPLLKKHRINLSQSGSEKTHASTDGGKGAAPTDAAKTALEGLAIADEGKPSADAPEQSVEGAKDSSEPSAATASEEVQAAETAAVSTDGPNEQLYGEVITSMVHELWKQYKDDSDRKVKAKIDEKQRQVTARVEAVQSLRTRAIETIIDADGAEVSSLKAGTPGDRNDVLLYDVSCVINSVPSRLHVTFGSIVYRTMVPFFATTTAIPFSEVTGVAHTTALGIQVVALELDASKHPKGLTIAMGLEVDLLFELLREILSMHQKQVKSVGVLPSLQQLETEKDQAAMKRILGDEEEEKEEQAAAPSAASATAPLSEGAKLTESE